MSERDDWSCCVPWGLALVAPFPSPAPREEPRTEFYEGQFRVELDDREVALAGKWAREFATNHDRRKWREGGYFVNDRHDVLQQHRVGVAGEIAFAKLLGVEYKPTKIARRGRRKLPDIQGHEVRTTEYRDGHLIVRVREKQLPEDRFALVIAEGPRSFRVVGWITRQEAIDRGDRRNPEVGRRAGDAWFVSQTALHAFQIDRLNPGIARL